MQAIDLTIKKEEGGAVSIFLFSFSLSLSPFLSFALLFKGKLGRLRGDNPVLEVM